jgi:hypothetical protein
MLRFVSTRVHGMLDYMVSALVIASPFLGGWGGGGRWIFVALGCLGIIYSLLTDYEWGAVRLLPMTLHLVLDVVFGVAMLVVAAVIEPPRAAWVSAAIGLLALMLAVVTRWRPEDRLRFD